MTIIESILAYFTENCELFNELGDILIDYLPEETLTISIEPTPSETKIQTFVDDSTERQYQFVIAARFNYSEIVQDQLNNSGFFERLQNWMEEQTVGRNLPDLGENRKATSIEAVSSGYLYNVEETVRDARYQIQCVLKYDQEAMYKI